MIKVKSKCCNAELDWVDVREENDLEILAYEYPVCSVCRTALCEVILEKLPRVNKNVS